jgi:hypothetical protein
MLKSPRTILVSITLIKNHCQPQTKSWPAFEENAFHRTSIAQNRLSLETHASKGLAETAKK